MSRFHLALKVICRKFIWENEKLKCNTQWNTQRGIRTPLSSLAKSILITSDLHSAELKISSQQQRPPNKVLQKLCYFVSFAASSSFICSGLPNARVCGLDDFLLTFD